MWQKSVLYSRMVYGLLIFTLCTAHSYTQSDNKVKTKKALIDLLIKDQYDASDYVEMRISSEHTSTHNGAQNTYFQQVFDGFDIDGAITNLTIHKEKIYFSPSRFIKNVKDKLKTKKNKIDPDEAIQAATRVLGFPIRKSRKQVVEVSPGLFTLDDPGISRSPINITKAWVLKDVNSLVLCWSFQIESPYSQDTWDINVDMSTGRIEKLFNQTIYCTVGKTVENYPVPTLKKSPGKKRDNGPADFKSTDGSIYQVFAHPVESPLFGDQSIVVEPADSTASPFGWHDNDGLPGPEFTITKGNNVHAFQDSNSDNQSSGDEPDGGASLSFLFKYNSGFTTSENLKADVTNLFYWNNFVHDWAYQFGFDEMAGNFQDNNYGRGGSQGDMVEAHTLDGGDTNNATFSTPADGSRPKMRMFPWRSGTNSMSVLTPVPDESIPVGTADFGQTIEVAITGTLVLVNDGDSVLTDACEPLINENEIRGNIALIDRGSCFFVEKAEMAETAGSIACIICNNVPNEGAINLGSPENSNPVNIPVLSLSKENCDLLKSQMENGTEISVRLNPINIISASFDNSVVAHEYAHGITNRLAGGRMNVGCLSNNEEAGEGWSDFFGLVLTHRNGDKGSDSRPLASFLAGNNNGTGGLRRYPYSTELNINPQIHSHIRRTQSKHALGEVWATVLWEMYWAFIEQDGFDPEWSDSGSGNYKAVQLIFDGLKQQPCNAGLLEARDAILTADQINYEGLHQCLIWKAFAKRGMGVDATAGSRFNRQDNVDGFEIPGSCFEGLKISKNANAVIEAGEIVSIQLLVQNDHSEKVDNVVVTDEMMEGTNLISSSVSRSFEIIDGKVHFDIGRMDPGEQLEINFEVETDQIPNSDFIQFNNFEGALAFEHFEVPASLAGWKLSSEDSEGGVFSVKVVGDTLEGDSFLSMAEPVLLTGINPTLKFWHRYNSQTGIDGGVVEVSTDQGQTWQSFEKSEFLLNGYSDAISFNFLYSNILPTFTGNRDWIETHISLSKYTGLEILLRFRYIMQQFSEKSATEGWIIDNFEIYNRQTLSGTACVSSGSGETVCDSADILVNSLARIVSTQESDDKNNIFEIFPSPVVSTLNLYVSTLDPQENAAISILNDYGQVLDIIQRAKGVRDQHITYDMSNYPPGIYYIHYKAKKVQQTQKVIKI